MPEQDGGDSKEPISPKKLLGETPTLKNFLQGLRRTRIKRRIIDTIGEIAVFSIVLLNPVSRNELINPFFRQTLLSRKYRVGLLEDSILANELFFPNEDGTSLEKWNSALGRWFAYDFHETERLGIKRKPSKYWKDGRLTTCLPNEIKDNPPNQYTPTYYIDIIHLSDAIYLDFPPFEQILKDGLLQETTYRAAYEKVGLLNRYYRYLALENLLDQPIYTVTPKGNGLVDIMPDFGVSSKKPKEALAPVPVLKPAFN